MDLSRRTKYEKKLDELYERLSAWRQLETNKSRYIPKEIWKEATILARALGVAPVSRKLGLFFPKLKSLAGGEGYSAKQKVKAEISSKPHLSFLEIPLAGSAKPQSNEGGFELRMQWGLKHFRVEWR